MFVFLCVCVCVLEFGVRARAKLELSKNLGHSSCADGSNVMGKASLSKASVRFHCGSKWGKVRE